MAPPIIRAVSFDAGETLVHLHPTFGEVFAATCARYGIELSPEQQQMVEPFVAERLAAHQRAGLRFSTSTEESRAFWQGAYRDVLVHFGVAPALVASLPARIEEQFRQVERYRLFDDALPVLEWLRTRDVKLGVISNWESWLEQLIAHLDLNRYFDFFVISGTLGAEKPDPRCFEEATRLAGVAPEEMLHVGDSVQSDLQGAQAAGLQAVLIDRHDRYPHVSPRVERLTELIEPRGLLAHIQVK